MTKKIPTIDKRIILDAIDRHVKPSKFKDGIRVLDGFENKLLIQHEKNREVFWVTATSFNPKLFESLK